LRLKIRAALKKGSRSKMKGQSLSDLDEI